MLKDHKGKDWWILIAVSLIVLIAALSCILFRNFIHGVFVGDFKSHIAAALDNSGYSLMHKLMRLCYFFPYSDILLVVLMTGMIIGTGFGMFTYLRERAGNEYPKYLIVIVSFMLLFTGNVYIPKIFPHFYNHYTKTSQPWHNSTYILMRFFAVFVVWLYFRIYDQFKDGKFSIKDGVCFALALTLCNYAKPNFFLAFAPASLIVFLVLFLKDGGRTISGLLKWGMCYVVSIPCILLMMNTVYNESTQSSIAFSAINFIDYCFGSRRQFFVYEISNLAFPFFTLFVFSIIRIKKGNIELNRLIQGFLMFFIAHLEQLLMIEEGPRASHGNYAWGVYCFGMLLFMICIGEWLRAYGKKQIKNKTVFQIGIALFSLHILSGIIYFGSLLRGIIFIQ